VNAARISLDPTPTPEEAAAIVAALEALRERPDEASRPKRNRWRMAGLLGQAPPMEMKLEGSLWSYSSWRD
jgi:predicted DNA-binding transcriptional regulator YafY